MYASLRDYPRPNLMSAQTAVPVYCSVDTQLGRDIRRLLVLKRGCVLVPQSEAVLSVCEGDVAAGLVYHVSKEAGSARQQFESIDALLREVQ